MENYYLSLGIHIISMVIPLILIYSSFFETYSSSLLMFVYASANVFLAEVANFLLFMARDTGVAVICAIICLIGKTACTYFMTQFLVDYFGFRDFKFRRPLLFCVNIVIIFMMLTNQKYHLYFKDIWMEPNGRTMVFRFIPGIGHYLYVTMILMTIMICFIIILLKYTKRKDKHSRIRALLVSAGVFSPTISICLGLFKRQMGDSALSICLTVSSILFLLTIKKYHLFDMMQNAKEYVLDHSVEAIMVVDEQKKILYMNKIVSMSNPQLKLFHSMDQKFDNLWLPKSQFQDKGRVYESVKSPICYSDQTQLGYLIEVRDVTENVRKKEAMNHLKKEAETANQAKSTFLSKMSYEIRTPINAILGMNEMILRESEDSGIIEYASNIQNAGNTLLSLINDILDFSKIESGEMEIVSNTYDLREILANASQLVETRLQGKEVSFVIETNRAMPRQLFGDKNRVQQVLVNILTNAAKYTLEGNITLKTDFVWVSESNQSTIELRFEVRDTGIGIKKEDLEKLFHSFQRVDEKNNRNIEGTGLGLVITKSLLDCMNGRIDVESEYGVGSVFTLYIPQKVIDKTPIGDSEMKKITAKSGRYQESFHAPEAKVLIVDDNRVNIKVIEGLLKKTWVQITAVESGEECLTIVEKEHFDLILMDHLMPGLDGIETLHRMLDNEEQMCRNVPVIALTANAMQGVREMYLENGFSDYLMKPVNSDELEKMLIKYLPGNLVKLL